MRNPFKGAIARLRGVFASRRASEAPEGATDRAIAEPLGPSRAISPKATEVELSRLVRTAVREAGEEVWARTEQRIAGLEASLGRGLREVRTSLEEARTAFLGRIDALSSEVARLRSAVDVKTTALEERGLQVTRGIADLEQATARIGEECRSLGGAFDRQLSATEKTLSRLKESTEERIREMRDRHLLQVGALERKADEVASSAAEARRDLVERIEEAASLLAPVAFDTGVDDLPSNAGTASGAAGSKGGWWQSARRLLGRPAVYIRGLLSAARRARELRTELAVERRKAFEVKARIQSLAARTSLAADEELGAFTLPGTVDHGAAGRNGKGLSSKAGAKHPVLAGAGTVGRN
ncbi:MAG TPA: hypothetical protein VMT52_14965 [Planctomycetota bacterium]|nr:hypothetical protein [Planctomycetota bacterium]